MNSEAFVRQQNIATPVMLLSTFPSSPSLVKVLVGHTVHRDLEALRMDALLIFDISLLCLADLCSTVQKSLKLRKVLISENEGFLFGGKTGKTK